MYLRLQYSAHSIYNEFNVKTSEKCITLCPDSIQVLTGCIYREFRFAFNSHIQYDVNLLKKKEKYVGLGSAMGMMKCDHCDAEM